MKLKAHKGRIAALALFGMIPLLAADAPAKTTQNLAATDPVGAFVPDTVMAPSGLPKIVRLPADGAPIVALRLSIPFVEGAAEAGTGLILQRLGLTRARALATYVGAQVEGQRTPWGIAYTAVGPATDLDYLAYLLRAAVSDPSADFVGFTQARTDLMRGAERRAETPGGRITSDLRSQAAPSSPPLSGTAGSLARLTLGDLIRVWERTHQPDRMTLLVGGDIQPELLLASFRDMGAPPLSGVGPYDGPVSSPSRNRTQVLRHWYGEARAADGPAGHPELAAMIVAEHLRSLPTGIEAEVQLWETRESKVLAVVGAAYRQQRQNMRSEVQDALADAAAAVTDDAIAESVASVRADLLLGARTPLGRVAFVGAHLDATGSELGAVDYMQSLDAVTAESMRSYLVELAARSPVRSEVTP